MDPIVVVGTLSATAATFREQIASAIGGIVRPWQIKRVGAAEAEVDRLKALTKAQTNIEITDLQRRGFQRFIHEEGQRQANIENIIEKALPLVGDSARPKDVEDDWIVHFFDKCRLISDEEMQQLWARILAGQAEKPGRFSKRTIEALSVLEKADAEMFALLCRTIWESAGRRFPVIYPGIKSLDSIGLRPAKLQHLDDIGLISCRDGLAFSLGWQQNQLISYFDKAVELSLPADRTTFTMGLVSLTKVGQDLAPLCRVEPVSGYFEELLGIWRVTYRYQTRIVDADACD